MQANHRPSNNENDPPLVTIITPSFNQAAFLPATLQSVAMQDYPRIEHIILDASSTDGSAEILESWANHQIIWRSEPDGGQADAINKGVAMATGEIVAWLNSDDVYLDSHAITAVVEAFQSGAAVVTGAGRYIDPHGRPGKAIPVRADRLDPDHIRHLDWVLQPATFVRADVMREFPLDTSLNWAMDWDLFIRASKTYRFSALDREIAGYRLHGAGKTVIGGAARKRELLRVINRYHSHRSPTWLATWAVARAYTLVDGRPALIAKPVRKLAWWASRLSNIMTGDHGVPY